MGWRNLFHLGPLFIVGIIISGVWSTTHCNSLWWPPFESWSGFFNSAIFLILSATTVYSFLYSLYIGPGHLPLKWKPVKENDIQYLQFCTVCQGYKAPRSHHCNKCKRCVMKRDHHCVFINNCLGHLNHFSFIVLLISAVLMSVQACVVIASTIYQTLYPTYFYYSHGIGKVPIILGPTLEEWPFVICLTSFGLVAGVLFSLCFLFLLQAKAVFRNQTWIEDWTHEKAVNRREGTNEPPFIHPYNLGWRENVLQVINWSFQAKGNGVDWKVREGSHLYAFTIEQIDQKKTKIERSVDYVVEKTFDGNWLPIGFGIKVFLQPPLTYESRISLRIGDKVAVSRWKKHWLYGEIKEREGIKMNLAEHRSIRGWFPRSCCSPFTIELKLSDKGE